MCQSCARSDRIHDRAVAIEFDIFVRIMVDTGSGGDPRRNRKLQYAATVVGEMLRMVCSGGRIPIQDAPDAAKREACEAARRAAGAPLIRPIVTTRKTSSNNWRQRRSVMRR
jgi:hypothetical protein